MKRTSAFTAQPSLAEGMLCRCPHEGLSPQCQEIIGTVEELTGLVSQQDYDASEVATLMDRLLTNGASEKKIHDFFAARFILGFGVNQSMNEEHQNVEHEVKVLRRIGLPEDRIQRLLESGKQVKNYCQENHVPADHLIATFVTEGRSPASLVLSL